MDVILKYKPTWKFKLQLSKYLSSNCFKQGIPMDAKIRGEKSAENQYICILYYITAEKVGRHHPK
jgi:hypothetical protein